MLPRSEELEDLNSDTKSRALLKPFSFRLFVNHFLIITDRDGAVDALR